MSYLNKSIQILTNDGVKVFLIRLKNYSIVKIKRLLKKNEFGNWPDLKNKYKEKRLFVLGNGPSLNQTPLHLLKDEYTMCFNRINLLFDRIPWRPDFYLMTDDLLIQDMHNEVRSEILPKVSYAFFPDIHPSNVDFKNKIGDHENVFYLNTDEPKFSLELPKCGINKTVVNAGLQVAAFLGFKEIYLIGVDMTFSDQKIKKKNSRDWTAVKDDDPNHFDPRYFGKGRSYHNPTVHEMIEQFEKGKVFFEKKGVKIKNAGIGGKLEVFERVKFSELFRITAQKELENLLGNIENVSLNKTLEDTFPDALHVFSEKDWEDTARELITTVEIGITFISKKIHNYIPLGPYHNKYLFLSRKFYSASKS